MGKITLLLYMVIAVLFLVKPAVAENVAGSSAKFISSNKKPLAQVTVQQGLYYKKKAIKQLLEANNSPMVEAVDAFINACTKYDLNCYLLPSIAGLESSYGKHIYPGSYNPFGWGGGYIMFNSWGEAIEAVAKGLRNNYVNRGATSVDSVGTIYAASPTWAVRVKQIQSRFEKLEEQNQLFLDNDGVKL